MNLDHSLVDTICKFEESPFHRGTRTAQMARDEKQEICWGFYLEAREGWLPLNVAASKLVRSLGSAPTRPGQM